MWPRYYKKNYILDHLTSLGYKSPNNNVSVYSSSLRKFAFIISVRFFTIISSMNKIMTRYLSSWLWLDFGFSYWFKYICRKDDMASLTREMLTAQV